MIVSRLLLAGFVLAASPALAAPKADAAGRLTARIYDYANVNRDQMQAAQQQVAETYGQIGVTVQWLDTARPNAVAAGQEAWPTDDDEASMVNVALITGAMAEGVGVPQNVAGYAATDNHRQGRMAFVVVDRTERIAFHGQLFHWRVLGAVMAHEIAHLLLPRGAHARIGLMRPSWSAGDFAMPGRQTFSQKDATAIRQSVGALTHATGSPVAD